MSGEGAAVDLRRTELKKEEAELQFFPPDRVPKEENPNEFTLQINERELDRLISEHSNDVEKYAQLHQDMAQMKRQLEPAEALRAVEQDVANWKLGLELEPLFA